MNPRRMVASHSMRTTLSGMARFSRNLATSWMRRLTGPKENVLNKPCLLTGSRYVDGLGHRGLWAPDVHKELKNTSVVLHGVKVDDPCTFRIGPREQGPFLEDLAPHDLVICPKLPEAIKAFGRILGNLFSACC